MVLDLPPDLVEEILSRVPAKNLWGLRFTCKQWCALFKDQRFTEKQVRKSAKQCMLLMLKDYRVCSMSVNNLHESDKNADDPSTVFMGELDLKDSRTISDQVDVSEIFHRDGLLLCSTKDNSLVVWNPCTGQTKWIQHIHAPYTRKEEGRPMYFLGYGNNKSHRSYKILRYWDDATLSNQVVEFEIYDFSSDSWRVLNNVTCNFVPRRALNVSLFRFRADFRILDHKTIALSVVREEQLSFLLQLRGASKVDVWVTNKIDTKQVLWSKFFTVDIYIPRQKLSFDVSFVIDKVKRVAVGCEPRNSKKIKNVVYIVGEDRGYSEIDYGQEENS
ncbi:unnamed protein product [Arabidopsis thaliana]|uniref:F-box domain-containing protein n=1 Tax=Arabidopsis thaliana TaxID=3702 RepID=A0A654FVI0_ARATH|nr:unnamed protein product [Arabidopsis thaliana]